MTTTIENSKKVLRPSEGRHLTQDGQNFVDTVIAPLTYDDSQWRDSTIEEEEYIASIPVPARLEPDGDEMYESILVIREKLSTLTDEEALGVAALFPTWVSMDKKPVNIGERYWYDGNLYKVAQAHTVQQLWNPKDSPALFVVVTNEVSEADGSINNPYEWIVGMVAEQGKYYIFNGITYLCIRSSETPLYFEPSALLGNYFEEV